MCLNLKLHIQPPACLPIHDIWSAEVISFCSLQEHAVLRRVSAYFRVAVSEYYVENSLSNAIFRKTKAGSGRIDVLEFPLLPPLGVRTWHAFFRLVQIDPCELVAEVRRRPLFCNALVIAPRDGESPARKCCIETLPQWQRIALIHRIGPRDIYWEEEASAAFALLCPNYGPFDDPKENTVCLNEEELLSSVRAAPSNGVQILNFIPSPDLRQLGISKLAFAFEKQEAPSYIPDCFLYKYDTLEEVDLSGLRGISEIGKMFLWGCQVVQALDLSVLKDVTSVGAGFCGCCTNLTSMNLSLLGRLTRIPQNFLSSCANLTELDLSPLHGVSSVGMNFLGGACQHMKTIDLRGLENLQTIQDNFLRSCSGIVSLSCAPLVNLTRIGSGFLANCANLRSLDLNGLGKVVYIGAYFLSGCSQLLNLDFSPLCRVATVRDPFLQDCNALSFKSRGAAEIWRDQVQQRVIT